jgi:hypothetical protein
MADFEIGREYTRANIYALLAVLDGKRACVAAAAPRRQKKDQRD